jgi:uncharacterized ferritin-like protein (DUF455 family)
MELREWAILILGATSLEDKLYCPEKLTDHSPQEPLFWQTPSRPANLSFKKFTKEEKLPPFHEHHSQTKRALCLHRFAAHELLAVEIMAYALLAFPHMPTYFRKGLANTLKEEQEHVRIYRERLKKMGTDFGDHPVNGRFWSLTPHLKTPEQYLSVMHLTLEMANLDFAPHYALSFQRNGDSDSANLMKQIFEDEISHVKFGYHWLDKIKPEGSSIFETYLTSLNEQLPPSKGKGFVFQEEARKKIGLPKEWIDFLKKS